MRKHKTKQKFFSFGLMFISFIVLPIVTFLIFYLDILIESIWISLRLTEILTVACILILFVLHWRLPNKHALILPVIIGVQCALVLIYLPLVWGFFDNAISHTQMGHEKEREFLHEQYKYIPLITTIFDKAEKTNVRYDIDTHYSYLLEYPKPRTELMHGRTFQVFSPQGRKPMYFIRLKGNKLEKLFQSGDIKYETVDTSGEKKVVEMLQGKRDPITFPQYTCCGGNDPWPEIPFLRVVLPERRYLKDFYSELETILLIRDGKGNILGAMVDLHGD